MLNDRAGFDAFIGRALGHADGDDAWSYCDERAARELAMAALRRLQTRHLSSHAPNTVVRRCCFCHSKQCFGLTRDGQARARMVGLGCTATLSSTTPHRGAHRAHIAIATCAGVTGARDCIRPPAPVPVFTRAALRGAALRRDARA